MNIKWEAQRRFDLSGKSKSIATAKQEKLELPLLELGAFGG